MLLISDCCTHERKVVLEADPACWKSPPAAPTAADTARGANPAVPPAPPSAFFDDFLGAAPRAAPLLLGTAQGVALDLGILARSKNVHLAIGARRLELHDLRLAYRPALCLALRLCS